jgi:hypothetical protein
MTVLIGFYRYLGIELEVGFTWRQAFEPEVLFIIYFKVLEARLGIKFSNNK